MCGVPIHAAEAYLARLIKAGHRVAIAEQTESPAEAKKRGVEVGGQPRDRPRRHRRHADRGGAARFARAPTGWSAVARSRASGCGIAAADISTGRFELARSPPAALDAELARLGAAEIVAPEPLPGADAELRARGFDSIAAERRLKERFGVATLDGFGRFDRAALCAAGRPARLSRRGRARGAALPAAAGRRASRRSYGDRRGDARKPGAGPLGARAAAPAACSTRSTAPSPAPARGCSPPISARRCSIGRGSRRGSTLVALVRRAMAGCATTVRRGAARLARHRPRARPAGRAARRPARPRPVARRPRRGARGCTTGSAASRTRAGLAREPAARAWSAMARWSICSAARWCPRRRSTRRRAAISPRAMTRRSTRCARPAARAGARSPRWRRATASETGIAALKIRHNGVLGYHIEVPARNADRLMAAEFGLHPSPDAGRRRPLQRARSARAGDRGSARPARTRSPPKRRISRS